MSVTVAMQVLQTRPKNNHAIIYQGQGGDMVTFTVGSVEVCKAKGILFYKVL